MADVFSSTPTDFEQMQRPKSLKMAERIARQMVDFILANDLSAGTRLPVESEMCRMLDVGRNTLREGMRLLEAWGVIQMRQGRNGGAIVRRPTPSDLRGPLTVQLLFDRATLDDILEIRLMMEPETAYLAAQKMSDRDTQDLDESVERMRANLDGPQELFLHENRVFHAAVAAHTRNIVLRSYIESIEAVFDGTTQGMDYGIGRRAAVADAHALIADAIRRRDPERARIEMRTHLDDAGSYWRQHRELMTKRLEWPR